MTVILHRVIKKILVHTTFCSNLRKYCIKPPWNVVFFGTDDFSLYSLKMLYREYKKNILINKLSIVTTHSNKINPVNKFALQEALPVRLWPLCPSSTSDHVGIIVSFGKLIPERIINSFPMGMLNIHASLLPRWRGAAPIIYAIANGDNKTGITVMKIKPRKFDVGDIILQKCIDIPNDIRLPDLHKYLANLGAEALIEVLTNLPSIIHKARKQSDEGVTYAPKVTSSIAKVSWSKMTTRQVYNLERALTGMFHLTTTWNGLPIKLHDVCVCDDDNNCNYNLKPYNKTFPGFVLYDRKKKVLKISCADKNWISVKGIGIKGKKIMNAEDFNNGYIKNNVDVFFV